MSTPGRIRRITVPELGARKGGEPIVCLTAYSTPMARLLDPHIDLFIVGDSVGMVLYGMDSTLAVTLEMMIAHGCAVMRGSTRACVVVDMPFGSYQESPSQALRNAARLMAATGCSAVKLEGGEAMAETIAFLCGRGIPVMGHVGLTPQSVNALGGYRVQGRTAAQAARVGADARAVADAGAFAVVIEGTVEKLARQITAKLPALTIGIGASPACDGQVLVTEDVLGLFSDFTPSFVKRFADLAPAVSDAVAAYAREVKARRFPGPEHCFGPAPKRAATGRPKTR